MNDALLKLGGLAAELRLCRWDAFQRVAMKYNLWPRVREILKENFQPKEEKQLLGLVLKS